jgi:hypothetical protein
MMNGKGPITKEHDLVVMCLPHSWLTTMNWEGELLRHSMIKHIAYFDRPRTIFAFRSCSMSRSGATRFPARGGCPKRSAAAAFMSKARDMMSAATAC